MKFLKNPKFILLFIIILASLLRIINLANWPISFNQDEALNGYEAYSIFKTGRDHRGNFLPLFFEGFSDRVDNRSPLYIYSTIPSVAILGLNKFAVRLPAVIFGILTVLLTYFLAKEFFKKESIALLASFFLAVSPWHIFLSRISLEAITVPFFSTLTIFFFLKGLKNKGSWFVLVGFSFAALFYTYHIAKLLAPLLGIILTLVYWKKIKEVKSWLLIPGLIFLIIVSPLFFQLSHLETNFANFNEISIFNFYFWPLLLMINLFLCLNLSFFFTHYPIFVVFFLFLGIYFLRKSIGKREIKLIFFILIISLLPAILTLPNPHPTRAVLLIPFLEIIAAFGTWKCLHKIEKRNILLKKPIFIAFLFLGLIIFNLNFLLKNRYPYKLAPLVYPYKSYKVVNDSKKFHFFFFQDVPKEVIDYIKENQNRYDKVVFTNKANQPYVFFLFFLNYPPEKFQSLKVEREYLPNGWQRVVSFDKYRFCDLNKCYKPNENNLYIARANEIPQLKEKKIFHNLDGSVFRIITND